MTTAFDRHLVWLTKLRREIRAEKALINNANQATRDPDVGAYEYLVRTEHALTLETTRFNLWLQGHRRRVSALLLEDASDDPWLAPEELGAFPSTEGVPVSAWEPMPMECEAQATGLDDPPQRCCADRQCDGWGCQSAASYAGKAQALYDRQAAGPESAMMLAYATAAARQRCAAGCFEFMPELLEAVNLTRGDDPSSVAGSNARAIWDFTHDPARISGWEFV